MIAQLKNSKTLTKDEIDRLYTIHEKQYFNKGIGHSNERWIANLLYPGNYHQITASKNNNAKEVYIFGEETIDGYTINVPIKNAYKNTMWTKIIEAAVDSKKSNTKTFLEMIKTQINPKKNYFCEIDSKSTGIISIVKQAGFKNINSELKAKILMNAALGNCEFNITKYSEYMIINRNTKISSNYEGCLLEIEQI